MDGTVTTVIILIFVFSIIGGVTGKKGTAPTRIRQYQTEAPGSLPVEVDTGQLYSTVNVTNLPGAGFTAGYTANLVESMKTFIKGYAPKVEPWEAQQISNNIITYSQKYDVNPKVVFGLIARESRFNRFAVSSSGAQGLGQLLPSTAAGLGVTDGFDIEQNVMGTSRYVRSLMDRFPEPNKVTFSLAGYLEGPNIVKKRGSFKSHTKSYIEDILKISNRI